MARRGSLSRTRTGWAVGRSVTFLPICPEIAYHFSFECERSIEIVWVTWHGDPIGVYGGFSVLVFGTADL